MMLGLIVPLVFPILFPGLLVLPFAVWMAIDCWTHPSLGPVGRIAWTLGMVGTLGAAGLFYFWIVRPSRHALIEAVNEQEDRAATS